MPNVDKLIITNRKAMEKKYGPAGLLSIDAALAGMIKADSARGIATYVLNIDDGVSMTALRGHPVVNEFDERGAVAAVDAAFYALIPDYVMLLDGPDVVPHIKLNSIAGLDDDDQDIPSDLPYASSSGWSRQAASFLTITRVVGRLPAAEGETDPATLANLIEAAAKHAPQPATGFQQPFAMSAEVWRTSTQLSVATTFGPGFEVLTSPDRGHSNIDEFLPKLAHFINCHGGQADYRFYGQRGDDQPVAMESALIGPHIAPGSVVAAECCYGAELYSYSAIGVPHPICMDYLFNGASAFVGSTNIAYGPAESNGSADLITQYFMQGILEGRSSGSAFLRARQSFVQSQIMSGATNLKTIAQFVLLGDPSLQPCEVEAPPAEALVAATQGQAKGMAAAMASSDVLATDQDRKLRRQAAHSAGLAIGASATMPGQKMDLSDDLRAQLTQIANAKGVEPTMVTLVATKGGSLYRRAAKAEDVNRKVATVFQRVPLSSSRRTPIFRVMVAHIINGHVAKVEISESH